jgi:hypothetical protein
MRFIAKLLTFFAVSGAAYGCGDDEPVPPSTTTSAGAGGHGAWGGDGGTGAGVGGDDPFAAPYEWESRFVPGAYAVAHDGQTFRHVLIESMKSYIGGLTTKIDGDMNPPQTQAELLSALLYYYEFDGASSGGDSHGITTDPPPLATDFDGISSGKMLKDKFAGNDASTDHKDWKDGVSFVGWTDLSINGGQPIDSPEELLLAYFDTLGALVQDRVNGTIPNEPGTTTPISKVYVTATGLDLRELIQKFLLMGVTFSQGTDDYLDDATDGKGLLTSNSQDGDNPWSVLEHQWDEGFGYFGAAHDYSLYSDEEIAGSGGRPDWQLYHDTNGDGFIHFMREFNWGASTNAAKRDLGATVMTDFTKEAFDALVAGRELIMAAGDPLSSDELDELIQYAGLAVKAWDEAIAATVVHYINDVIADTEAIDDDPAGYNFYDHAKHFSELKGFALGLQFNPRSPISDADFVTFHTLVGDKPVLADASAGARTAYVQSLILARDIFAQSYGFANQNVEGW